MFSTHSNAPAFGTFTALGSPGFGLGWIKPHHINRTIPLNGFGTDKN